MTDPHIIIYLDFETWEPRFEYRAENKQEECKVREIALKIHRLLLDEHSEERS